jgi:hypothetical protein
VPPVERTAFNDFDTIVIGTGHGTGMTHQKFQAKIGIFKKLHFHSSADITCGAGEQNGF